MAISQEMLIKKANQYYSQSIEVLQESYQYKNRKKVFLCHSHDDKKLIEGLIRYFEEQGVDLYVDWKDGSMPSTPNKVTAEKIRNRIRQADGFMFLATANSKASRWCPWEIGFADAAKKEIFIIPTTDGSNNYGNEYLDLYDHIDFKNSSDGSIKNKLAVSINGNWKWFQ